MKNNSEKNIADLLRVEGVNSLGFGTIPKIVMKDQRLTIYAKLIYAYFCTYAGAGNQAFPGRDIILRDLKINKDTYHKHLNMLKQHGYIRVRQTKKYGRFLRNIYTLVACPKPDGSASPCPTKPDTVKKPPYPISSDTVSSDTKRNRFKNNHVYLPTNHKRNMKASASPKSDGGLEGVVSQVKEQIGYDALLTDQNRKMLDSILNAVVDVLTCIKSTLRVGGVDMEVHVVQERYRQLNYADVAYVMNTIDQSADRIVNPRGYLLTVLYNAPVASEVYWDSESKYVLQEYHRRKEKEQREHEEIAILEEMKPPTKDDSEYRK